MLSLANPPVDVGALAFVALIPLLWSLTGARMRRGALLGFVFGLVYYGLLLLWLKPFGIIAWLPLVVSQAAYAALFGTLAPLLRREGRPYLSSAAFAAAWTAVDWARGTWPIGGFTWGGLGYTQHGNGLLLPLASVTGVWGVTFVIVLVNAILLEALSALRTRRGRAVTAAVAAGALIALPTVIPMASATPSPGGASDRSPTAGTSLDVAVLQGNVPLAFASDRLLQTAAVVQNQVKLQRQLVQNPPQLVVWPENSLYDDPEQNLQLGSAVSSAIQRVGAPTLVGGIASAPGNRFFNQTILYSGRGQIVDRYTKIHLVPFGEYIPFRAVLGWTDKYRRGNALLAPGSQIRLFRIDGVRVATPICFENSFPNLFRRFVEAGANLVVVTTNDSSFLFSPASREHVIMSQVRAVETGRWVVQAAISGESAVIDPRGRVVQRTGLFTQTILRSLVPAVTGETVYTRLGDWFPWACGLLVLGWLASMAMVERQRGRRAGAPPAGESEETPTRMDRTPAPIAGGAAPRVLVILPTYNERETVAEVVTGVLSAGPSVEALVIDDNSPDGTGKVVTALAEHEARVRLISRSAKQGLASAYLAGFRKAVAEGYDVVVEMDADLSHRPEDLPGVIEGSATYDLTIGSRYISGGGVSNWSRSRVALSRVGNAYARVALRLPVSDSTSGFRAFRRPVLESLLANGVHSEGYAFQIEMAYRTWHSGFTVGEVPITFREREHGRSKLSRAIVAEALLKVGRWAIRDRLSRNGGRPSSSG